METSELVDVGIALALVLANGWFVLAEFALIRVRPTRLEELAAAGNRRAARALAITRSLDAYLASDQLGITVASLALGWVGEPALANLFEPLFRGLPAAPAITHGIAAAVAFILITGLHVVLGEQVPKVLALAGAEAYALRVARPLHVFHLAVFPLMKFLAWSSTQAGRLLGLRPHGEGASALSEDELRMVVAQSHRQGVLDTSTRELLDNVLDNTTRVARDVMTPRRDVVVLERDAPIEASIELAMDKEYTRYPLVDRAGVDGEQVLGWVHIKDLGGVATGRRRVSSLLEVARPPVFVPESIPVDRARRTMQARRIHFGIVVDEYGDFTGVLTLEDALEQLVGPIQDELDREPPQIVKRADGTVEVDGALPLDAARRTLGLALARAPRLVHTLGGYVSMQLGRPASPGDVVRVGDYLLQVSEVEDARIRRLRVSRA